MGCHTRSALLPQPPGQAGGRQPPRSPLSRQGIQKGVRGRVVRLTGAPENAGCRREQHKAHELEMLGKLVKMQGPVHLRPEYLRQSLRRERADQSIIQHSGKMKYRGEPRLGGHGLEDRTQLRALCRVAGSDDHAACSKRQKGRTQFIGSGRALATSRRQDQMLHPMLAHQMARQCPAQLAQSADDQYGVVFPQPAARGRGPLVFRHTDQTGNHGDAPAQGLLRLGVRG